MIVVPSFSERNHGDKKIVAAIIVGGEAAFTENVRERIDREGAVIEHHGADEERPDQHLESRGSQTRRISLERCAQQKGGNCQYEWRQVVIPIQKAQLGILSEVRDQLPFSPLTVARQKPAKVCPPKLAGQRRMEILRSIGHEVMAAVMGRPPERPFLIRRRSRKRDQKLEKPAGPVGAMCQEAMKSGGNRKHAHNVQCQTSDYCHRAHAGPDDEQTRQMHEEELHADGII